MNWYLVIECADAVRNSFVGDHSNIEDYGFNEDDFIKGEKIDNWKDGVFVQAQEPDDDGDPDDALQTTLMIPIFSKRLMGALKAEGITGFQYLKLGVLRPDGSAIKGFCIANVLNFIEALDHDRSKYFRFSDNFPNPNVRGEISGITKFVLKEDRLAGKDVIRLKDYTRCWFVSERFKRLFRDNKFTGYAFDRISLS